MIRSAGDSHKWKDEAFSEYCSDERWAPKGGCYHRMIRDGDWKLIYYHGYEPQLFNMREDPHELHDRASDPGCRTVLNGLTDKVLGDWNPAAIAALMREKKKDNRILKAWARNTHPSDPYRWDLRPEMNFLDQTV